MTVSAYKKGLAAKSGVGEDGGIGTNVLTSLDIISYKGLQVVRIRVPRQVQPTFLGNDCFLRVGTSTKRATGPQIAAVSKLFPTKH